MFIRTSFADVWRIDFILCTYNLFPFQLLTKDTKYFHDLGHVLRVLSHKDTTPQDKQPYSYYNLR